MVSEGNAYLPHFQRVLLFNKLIIPTQTFGFWWFLEGTIVNNLEWWVLDSGWSWHLRPRTSAVPRGLCGKKREPVVWLWENKARPWLQYKLRPKHNISLKLNGWTNEHSKIRLDERSAWRNPLQSAQQVTGIKHFSIMWKWVSQNIGHGG